MTTDIQVTRGGRSMGLTPQSMVEAVQLAEYAAKSGLCAVREPAQALVVLLTGMELGLSPMQSFRGIHVVNGKPVLSADLLVAIVRASGVCRSWLTVESSIDRCTIETHREGDASPVRKTWTSEDAKRAGLSTAVWRSYPAQMLRHRCAADLAREVYPDLALGCYTPDEVSDGRVSDGDVAVTVVRDDAPAQLAAPDALAAFVADLQDATDLAGVRVVYGRHDLGGTAAKPVTAAVVARVAALGYHINGVEAAALIGGTMPDATVLAYDSLAAVDRHADDEEGDGVVADVVRVLRRAGGLDAPTRVKTAAVSTCTALGVEGAAARIKSALSPTPPTPTGTDAPRASNGADVAGSGVAPAESAGAMAREQRTVLDTDTAHLDLAGTWRATEAGWRDHLEGMTVRRRVEASVSCNGAALGPAFITLAAERIVAIDAERPHVAGVARLTVIGVTQTLERVAYDASRARAAQGQRAA
jgi:hypothetical protein